MENKLAPLGQTGADPRRGRETAMHDMRPAFDAIVTARVLAPGHAVAPAGDRALLVVHLGGSPFRLRLSEHIEEVVGLAEGGAVVLAAHTLLKTWLPSPARVVLIEFGEHLVRQASMPVLGRRPGARTIRSGRLRQPAGVAGAARILAGDMIRNVCGFAFRSALTLAIIEGLVEDDGLVRRLDEEASEFACDRIDRALRLIEQDLAAPLSLGSLAAEAGISPFHLSRSFRRVTGFSIQGYLRQRRLKEACRLLSETRKPIAEIAYACGFSSQSRMTTVFRQMMDTTPLAFRNQCWRSDACAR